MKETNMMMASHRELGSLGRRVGRPLAGWMLVLGATWAYVGSAWGEATIGRPNVLFIAIDDQNDWVGPLDGHPLVQTPHLDRCAQRGTTFLNAHCQAPLCNPSRTSVLLGLRPSTTGIYGLEPWFRQVETLEARVTLPQHFRAFGYHTSCGGKIFHGEAARRATAGTTEFDEWGPPSQIGARPSMKLIPATPNGNHPLMDWGAFPHRDEDKGDYRLATWAVDQIRSQGARQGKKPLFLAIGFFLPHVPCYVTPEWLDRYPDDDSILPQVPMNDRDDTPSFSWYLHWQLPEPRLAWLREQDQWRNLVRSYLASTSFVDAQIGRILDELDRSGLADETVVVIWSDHGWHLGEKLITGKNSLWERSTRVPLLFLGPGVARAARCSSPVELLDLFPTLCELCHIPVPDDLEGHSLKAQLQDAQAVRDWPAITTHNQGNHAIRSQEWRYIRYADGSEELYHSASDPQEENNVIDDPAFASQRAELRRWLPTIDRPLVPGSAHRTLTYDAATGEAFWEGKRIEDR